MLDDHGPQEQPELYAESLQPETLANDATGLDSRSPGSTAPTWGNYGKWAGIGVLLLAGYLGFFGSAVPTGDETQYANWTQHVSELRAMFKDSGESVVKSVNRGGSVAFGTSISVADADEDPDATAAVKKALSSGDATQVAQALKEAQDIPLLPVAAQQKIQVVEPKLSQGMDAAILSGDAKFFHIYVFDSCDEDGDVVDVVIDGAVFATVPITHQGATLSVPVTGSSTSVEIRGVYDGGGGITVACRTSQGDFFMRDMGVGETQPLAIVK